MRWSRLVAGAGLAPRFRGARDPLITCVVEDSRQVRPGACFVAMRGLQADGHAFLDSAVKAGASAVVTERPVSVPEAVAVLIRGLAS